MTAGSEWKGQLGGKWAAEWRRTDRSFGPLTERLLQRSRDLVFGHVVDIGCGAGELSLALGRGNPGAEVVGVDISSELLEAAQARGTKLTNVSFELADAASWTPAEGKQPDLLISRHGVMFFDDPTAAFAHLLSIAAEGATIMFSCFRDARENDWVQDMARLLPDSARASVAADPDAPGPFAFANAQRVHTLLSAAGWQELEFEPFDYPMIGGAGPDPVEDALSYFLQIGPAAAAARELTEDERDRFRKRLRSMFEGRVHDGLVAMRAAAWIVSARKVAC